MTSAVLETQAAACIVCGEMSVEPFMDFGETALANKFLSIGELKADEPRFPLRMGFCGGCGHVQLTQAVPPPAMFEDYLYVSGASETLRQHLADLASVVVSRFHLTREDLVMDIGCNDGTLLSAFQQLGVRTLGVDPARNLAARAQGAIPRYTGFFNSSSAGEILERYGPVAVATATNTFPHIPALHDFVKGITQVLAPGGAFVIECHYLLDFLDQGAFDTVYHEHISYWALSPMMRLFEAQGMQVVNAERLPIHHGQLRVTVQRKGEGTVSPAVEEVLEQERHHGLNRLDTFREFASKAITARDGLLTVLADLKSQGKRIAGYGAPAKASTLLEFLRLGPGSIDYIVDRSPLKQGLYTPGSHIPIVSTERLLADMPDYVLLLAWNFADEVLAQQAEYRARGGKFILFLPEVSIV